MIKAVNDPDVRAGREHIWARFRGVPLTEETKAKLRASKLGRKPTAEHRAAVSAGLKLAWAKRKQAKQQTPEVADANFM